MTTYAQARDAVVNTLLTVWPVQFPNVPVFYDNADAPDQDQLSEFLGCSVDFMRSAQREIGTRPIMRSYGTASFVIAVRASEGYRISLTRADILSDRFRFSAHDGVTFQAPHLLPPVGREGWFFTELIVPFYFDG